MNVPVQFYLDPAAKEQGCSFAAPRTGDAGFDLYAAQSVLIPVGGQALVPTGLYIAIPDQWVGIVKDRSSMALKSIRTHAGVIDSGYRGEVKIILSNAGLEPYQIQAGDKFAQLLLLPCLTLAEEVSSVEQLGTTERGTGGFGSTGSN